MEIQRQKKTVHDVSLIPLINVIFLLLIFFLVAGTVEAIDTLEVDLPISDAANDKPHIDTVIYIKDNGKIAINNDVISSENLNTIISTIFIENPSQKITIKSDAKADASTLIDIMNIIEKSGGIEISLVTREVQ